MLSPLELKPLLAKQDISRKLKVLAVLLTDEIKPKTVSDIRNIAEANGLRGIRKWNISQILSSASDMVIRLPDGWQITDVGIEFLAEQGAISTSPIKQHQSDLRKYAVTITSSNTRAFVEECILALEVGLLRSAVRVNASQTGHEKV